MARKVISGIVLTLLLIGILTLAFRIQLVKAETIIVPDDYPTIQEAINNANEGDTIFVKNGMYYENMVVNKTVTLIGENKETTIIDGCDAGPVMKVTANFVIITGFTMKNATGPPGGPMPVAGGVELIGDNATIFGNILSDNFYGFFVDPLSSGNTIYGNNVTNNYEGMEIVASSYNNVTENSVTNNTHRGILVFGTGNNISKNVVSNNYYGFLICHFYHSVIAENIITCNMYGIYVEDSCCYIQITGNVIADNDYGMFFEYVIYEPKIFHNDFPYNLQQARSSDDSSYDVFWDNGYPSGGNYWSDYHGRDLNDDGIGDTPYILSVKNRDRYPLMNSKIPPPLPGDVNGDDVVGLTDLVLLALAYGSGPSDPNWNPRADLANTWGKIGLSDLVTLAQHYGEQKT